MTSIADAFPPRPVAVGDAVAPPLAVPVAPAKARVASDSRLAGVRSWLGSAARVVVADVRGAWAWFCRPPTLAELVAARVPSLDRVPGRSQVLRAGWAVYNHVVIVLFVVAYPALWVLAHPARLLLAAPLGAALFLAWA